MRLKSLDIQGFKSFADRTTLDFNDGITAVIGPNGSGKSNIADAVRWVLGEQSTRTLRGGKMEDVIFGGTQARKALGVASVTLNIDNTDRAMAGMDCDEVAITRRLYRSGDSEYRINGAQVRLKDINELFMDTGLGRDGYSIIGQGRVAEIVSARSKERREIFEEAAGISKFRYRKTEAERRLSLAEENLLRLRDILAELDGRLAPLRQQSEKAQKFLELAGEKKQLEVSVWMHTLTQLNTKAAALEDKLLLAQADFDMADSAVTGFEQAFAEEMERGRALMVAIETQRSEINRHTELSASFESQSAVLQNDISHHERSIAEVEAQIAQAGRSQSEIEAGLEAARQSLAQRQQVLQELAAQKEALFQQLNALILEQQNCSSELNNMKIRRAGAFEAIESARLDSAAAATLLGESAERIAAMSQAQSAREQAVADAKNEKHECEQLLVAIDETILSLDNEAKGYLLKQGNRKQKVEELDKQLNDLRQKIGERRSRARLLSDMDKNMEGFGQSIKYIMNQARAGAVKGLHGPVSSLITVADEHTVAIETALGGAMQNIVADSEETGKRAIGLLQSAKAGRATFLPLTSVRGNRLDLRGVDTMYGFVGLACDLIRYDKQYDGVITSLLGRVVVAEDLDAAVTIAKKHGYRFRIVTLDGQVVNAGGAMTGGYTAKSAGILGRQGEIDRLNQQCEALETQGKTIAERREAAAAELAAVEAELAAIAARRRTCEEDKVRGTAELSAATIRLKEAERQVRETAAEREALTLRIEEMKQKSGSAKTLTETLSAELEQLQSDIANASARSAELGTQRDALLGAQNENATQTALCERDIAASNNEISRLTEQVGATRALSGENTQKIAQLRAQIEEAHAQITELGQKLEAGRATAQQAQALVAQTMREREESERHCAELRAKEREESARRDGLYREVVRLGEQRNAARGERDVLVAKLYDEYELTQSAAEDIAERIEDIAAANRRLSELRGRIKSLGSVNVDAIEEYKEVATRHGELTRQLSDVERSKTELGKLINELTSQMCEIFTEKFEAINRNFGKTFRDLFEGGSASLSLTEPNDVLESGIEITVHPPGKLIKNLAALSGGEQAFVAIAIFFAILKVNPSPFCLMDEIEAALDDVNVSRFAAYLRTLTERTQFITITHRRGTMEEADVLYGVTMQEEGVSKLLMLNVSEIEKSFNIK
ncbi:MAG: chromosome segregation protein SMC [Candidatus Fimivivens sp.]|nr:chromosome segregation protein SMC [Candidatus Fimivivens sp.]